MTTGGKVAGGLAGLAAAVAAVAAIVTNLSSITSQISKLWGTPEAVAACQDLAGKYNVVRGWTQIAPSADPNICKPYYGHSMQVANCTFVFNSEHQVWKGVVTDDERLTDIEGDPPFTYAPFIAGKMRNAKMISAECGNGFFVATLDSGR